MTSYKSCLSVNFFIKESKPHSCFSPKDLLRKFRISAILTPGGQASMSVAPSPIITTFLKWNCSFRWLITFPFPPDSAVGCVSSNPAYSPRKQWKDKLEIQIFSCKWRNISACALHFIACSPVNLTAAASQRNNSKVSLRLGFHPSFQWGDFQRKIETFSEKNRNLSGQCYKSIPSHSGVNIPKAAARMMQTQCRKAQPQ